MGNRIDKAKLSRVVLPLVDLLRTHREFSWCDKEKIAEAIRNTYDDWRATTSEVEMLMHGYEMQMQEAAPDANP